MLSVANKQENTIKNPRRLGEAGEAGVVSTGMAEFVFGNLLLCQRILARLKIQEQPSRPTTKIPSTAGWAPDRIFWRLKRKENKENQKTRKKERGLALAA